MIEQKNNEVDSLKQSALENIHQIVKLWKEDRFTKLTELKEKLRCSSENTNSNENPFTNNNEENAQVFQSQVSDEELDKIEKAITVKAF